MSGTAPARKSVDQLLSDFDNLGTGAGAASAGPGATAGDATSTHKDAQSLLDDLDSLVQTARSGGGSSSSIPSAGKSAATVQGSTASTASSSAAGNTATTSSPTSTPAPSAQATSSSGASTGGWGSWGAVWSSATRLADQARAEIEKRAPPLTVSGISADGSIQTEKPVSSAQAQEAAANAAHAANVAASAAQGVLGRGLKLAEGVRGYVKESGWDKIGEDLTRAGRRGIKDIINAVAPPISAHEVLQVTLSHDMIGYDGIETVVFQALAKVMEQVERNDIEHQLVVNKAQNRPGGSLPKAQDDQAEHREQDLKAVEGFEAAFKLAEAELTALIKARPPVKRPQGSAPAAATPDAIQTEGAASAARVDSDTNVNAPTSLMLPITECPLFIRVQPLVAPLPGHGSSTTSTSTNTSQERPRAQDKHLFFAIVLQDPLHDLRHQVISQSVPWSWVELSFDTNAWVEQALVDVLHGALSIIGQDYVHGRSAGKSA